MRERLFFLQLIYFGKGGLVETIQIADTLQPGTVRWFQMNHKCGHSVRVGFWIQSNGWGSGPGFRPAHYEALEKQDCPKCCDEKARADEEAAARFEAKWVGFHEKAKGLSPQELSRLQDEYYQKSRYR